MPVHGVCVAESLGIRGCDWLLVLCQHPTHTDGVADQQGEDGHIMQVGRKISSRRASGSPKEEGKAHQSALHYAYQQDASLHLLLDVLFLGDRTKFLQLYHV